MSSYIAKLNRHIHQFVSLYSSFLEYLFYYVKTKIARYFLSFEKQKNALVRLFLMKRGRYNRAFLHITAMIVISIVVIFAPFLADTIPGFSGNNSLLKITETSAAQSIVVGQDVFSTRISQKPRATVIIYRVEKGDTLSTIAQKFSQPNNPISVDSIRWANDITGNDITVGDDLKIPPVTGVLYKVSKGDTVYSIAKKYNTNPQKIVDFPFNDFANPETFSLVEGEILVVPDGIQPSEQHIAPVPQVYIAQGPIPVSGGGFTFPVHGEISQTFSWYHQGIDIAAPYGTPLVAANNGTVTKVAIGSYDGGYGNNVYISNGAGFVSHYAHMSAVNVRIGQSVVGGRTVIGAIGLTGRTTGAHVHFEIIRDGVLVNPLSYLQ